MLEKRIIEWEKEELNEAFVTAGNQVIQEALNFERIQKMDLTEKQLEQYFAGVASFIPVVWKASFERFKEINNG